MKFTLSWLKDHLDTDLDTAEIGRRLTALGLEVEEIGDPASRLSGFIVGHVVEAGPHPDADRLKLCRVETGEGILQVVCGAPNARTGLKVILARPGTLIPATNTVLKAGKVRGIESQGMMCSWRELGLGEDHDGIAELDPDAPVGAPLTKVMSFDPVFDISITPNRADCLGVRGIARDLAAGGAGRLKPLDVTPVTGTHASPVGVRLDFAADATSACPLFIGRHIRGLKNGESPDWLKARLIAIGLRPISALVDITNYIAYDQARPLHVFDAATLTGDLCARLARSGEKVTALNGKTYDLDDDMIVIADDSGPLGLAGLMGGEGSGCSETTTDIVLEVALFDPVRIAAAGRKLDILSDARFRFERGVDPAFAFPAAELATRMILDLCGGEASELVVAGAEPDWHRRIALDLGRVEILGGMAIETDRQRAILSDLGCRVETDSDHLAVEPPSWRADIIGAHDLVEEILRIQGYDSIPAIPLPRPALPVPVLTPAQRRRGWVRRSLAARGLVETVTWSFLASTQAELFGGGAAGLHLANPISSDLDCMRPSPLPNLVAAAQRNADRGMRDLGLFEIGPAFDGPEPGQQRLLAVGLRAGAAQARHWDAPTRPVDAFDVKADMLAALAAIGLAPESLVVTAEAPTWYHPGRSGAVKLGNKALGHFGELHPGLLARFGLKGRIAGFELDLDALPPVKTRATRARPPLKLSPYQSVERDFAFVVDTDVAADKVARAARGADKTLITGARIFDLYEGPHVGEGKKSLAVTITLQPTAGTLTDAEIEAVADKVVAAVAKATGGSLRG